MKSAPEWKGFIALVAVLTLVVVFAVVTGNRTSPDTPPAPVPTVVVNPQELPSSSVKDVPKPKLGTVPNGITPPEASAPVADPVQVVALVDGLGGGPSVKYVTGGTKNPWTPQEAVAYAAGQVKRPDKNYLRLCAHSMSWYYGYYSYGYPSASAGGNATPKKLRHSVKDPKPIPAGALVYFVNQGQYGHVVLSNGDGRVYSNDINRAGKIDLVPLSVFKKKWGYKPSFWTPPYFPNAGGRNPNPRPIIKAVATPAPAPNKKAVVSAAALAKVCRRGTSYAGVATVRKALGISGGSKCDAKFRAAYKKWQRKLGYRGKAADGVPGKASLKVLAKKKGFTVS